MSKKQKKVTKKDLITFNLIWMAVFLAVCLLPLIKGGEARLWAAIVAVSFLLVALLFPTGTKGFYTLWIKFGDVAGYINSRIILGILFYLLITPVGVVMRMLGKDLLNKKIDKSAATYWESREVQPTSMKNQF